MIRQFRITIKHSDHLSDVISLSNNDGLLTFSYEEPERTSLRLSCKLEPADIVSPTSFFYELGALAAEKKAVFPLVDVALFVQDPDNAINVCRDRAATRRQFDQYYHPRDHKHNLSSLLQHLVPVFYQGYRDTVAASIKEAKDNPTANKR